MTAIHSLHFDTANLAPDHQFSSWRSAVANYDVSQADPDTAFNAVVDGWLFGDMILTAGKIGAARFVRAPAQLADGCDHLSLLILKSGSWTGDAGGQMLTAGPGQVVMFDLTRTLDAEGTANEHVTLRLPRAAISAVAPDSNLHGLMFHDQIGRVLADHLMMLTRYMPHASADEAGELACAALDLVASCTAVAVETSDAKAAAQNAAIRHRIARCVDARVGTPDLTIANLCRDAGVSRSVLYRTFKPLGGIAVHIRSRRLEAAHAALERTTTSVAIAAVAAQHGFVSGAHFSRAFRCHFGYSPRHARNGKAALRESTPKIDTALLPKLFRDWLAQLD